MRFLVGAGLLAKFFASKLAPTKRFFWNAYKTLILSEIVMTLESSVKLVVGANLFALSINYN